MSVKLQSKNVLQGIISFINEYTEKTKADLTEALKELVTKCDKGYASLKGLCQGNVSEIREKDIAGITRLIPYLFQDNTELVLFEIPSTVTEIGRSCFNNCKNAVISSIPESVTALNASVFSYCEKATFTKLPDALTEIGANACSYCKNITITEIPAGVNSIGRSAFYGCTSLRSITFKGTPTSLDRTTFQNCYNITEINVPWAEGEIANAPWGATNATVNYNCTE